MNQSTKVSNMLTSRDTLCLIAAISVALCLPGIAAAAREEIKLDGEWQYQQVSDLSYPPPNNWEITTVPGYLSGYNYEKAWFRKTFSLPTSLSGMRIKLQFGGVKYDSTVYLNGEPVGGCLNGYNPFELDVTDAALPGKENELLVALSDWTTLFSESVDFSDLAPGENPRDRTRDVILAPIGGRYDLYGIWQSVTVRIVPDFSIEDVFVLTSVREEKITIRARLRNDSEQERNGTLDSTVLDEGETALLLPGADVTVAPQETLDVEVESSWPDTRLWSLSDPHLYDLETTLNPTSGTPDSLTSRFGFREFWCQGQDFYLNGTKLHLLATSCWPSTNLMQEDDIRNVLQDVKAGNNVAFRLHTQPWNETWYDVADEVGVLIVEEGAVWCDPRAYRLSDPTFWSNFGDHLRAAVVRDRNHPSLIMWSLENELLHCGAANVYAGTEAELANLGRLVKELDPNRPITYEADLDPGGEADVVGLHYPHEFPSYHLWPNTAYWMDEPIPLSHAPGGTWQWNRQKPLYIGEFLWVPASSPDGFSILYGDDVYTDLSYYRNRAKGWTWRMQIEAFREYGVSAVCPWTMFEDVATRWGTLDLNPEENHLYQVQKAAYHPNAVFIKEYDTRFFAGESVERTLTVYNDTLQAADFRLTWTVAGKEETRTLFLQPAERRQEIVTFAAPSSPGDFTFRIALLQDETTVFSDERQYSAYPQPSLSVSENSRLALYDTEGTTRDLLTGEGIDFLPVEDLQTAPYEQFGLLLVGKNSLREEELLSVGAETIAAKWEDFAARGGWVVVLEQPSYPRWMPLALSPTDYQANFAFPRAADHPIVAGLSPEHLRWWRGSNLVTAGNLPKPSRGNFRVLIDVGSQNGLDHAAIIEIPRERGGFICSQMLLTTKSHIEPMAGILLQRILDYCSMPKPQLRHAGLVTEADSQAARALSRLGLLYENLSGRLASHDLTAYPLLLIAGGDEAWSEATSCAQKLAGYVERGGKLILHRPSDDFLAAAGPVLLPNLEAAPNTAFPILRNPSAPDTGGLTNYDLYWIDEPGSWDRQATLSTTIARRVFRKQFTLTNFTTLQVEDMPIKSAGSPITGGWNLYVNGYVAQTITISTPGQYLFGVVARGTQALGEYPRMELRVDGKFCDAVTVDSESWRLFSLAAEIPAGDHELALAFTNDAWDPPDDRNLYMDQVRYGFDPSPETELFITRPGAIVQVNRGEGLILLDEITWEEEEKNRGKAERILSTLLTELGAVIRSPSGLRIEAEEMTPVGFGYFRIQDGIAWCGSNGRLEASVLFTTDGEYSFEVTGYGTPALGIYPELELRIDGTKRDSVTVNTESPGPFLLSSTISAGTHTVALAFVNDYYDPPEDRNLALDRVIISQAREAAPQWLHLAVNEQNRNITLVWEAQPETQYRLDFLENFGTETWRVAGYVTAAGNVASWTDDGSSTGLPPGNDTVRHRFYRIGMVNTP